MKKLTKILIIIALLILLLAIGWFLRCRTNVCDIYYSSAYEDIDSRVKDIDGNEDLKKLRERVTEGTSEGGEIVRYSDDFFFNKIEASFFGEMGNIKYDFYYDEEGLIYLAINEKNYDMPMYVPEHKIISDTKDYLYFKGDNLIKWKSDNQKDINRCSQDFKDKGSKIKQIIEELDLTHRII